jgi:D-beta-D-heptose 7-phosphate kinase/D-beta-D-heptose 1-phosphate adenosyltransferase
LTELTDIQQQKKYKILLIGDSCIDRYYWGTCNRISPEAPVPIFNFESVDEKKGMAANVQSNLEAFGLQVDFITNKEVIVKSRYIDKKTKQHLLRVDFDVECRSLEILPKSLDYDIIVISDYDKGLITYEYLKMIRSSYKGKIFIDTKKKDLKELEGFTLKINKLEWKSATSFSDDVIITMGDQGALYKGKIYPAPEVNVFDVCGAGDTFLAALVKKYLESTDMEIAIKYANLAAGEAVKHVGVYVLTKKDIETIDYKFEYVI